MKIEMSAIQVLYAIRNLVQLLEAWDDLHHYYSNEKYSMVYPKRADSVELVEAFMYHEFYGVDDRVDSFDRTEGLCPNALYRLDVQLKRDMFTAWEYFSGCYSYPVPDLSCDYYDAEDKYDKESSAGDLYLCSIRKDLTLHCLEYLTKYFTRETGLDVDECLHRVIKKHPIKTFN